MKDVEPFDEQQHVIQAFTELAPQYEQKMNSELNLFWGWSYDELIGTLLNALPDLRSQRILDLATGKLVIPRAILADHPDIREIIGLDITYRMLRLGKAKLNKKDPIHLLCASALDIPLKNDSFTLITCALATHHMNVQELLSEIYRILAPGGSVVIVDVGASKTWMNPIVQFFIKILAFFFFLIKEGVSRAWAEASALPNIRTADDWKDELMNARFVKIKINKLESRRFGIPDPILIIGQKENEE